jgi:hypothetical protein
MSRLIINLILVGMWFATWMDVKPFTDVSIALWFTVSYYILILTGIIPKDNYERKTADDEEISKFLRTRAKANGTDAVITTTDKDGNFSKVIIKSDGEIIVKGKHDEDLIEAALSLRDVVVKFGPEIVAKELNKQVKIEEAKQKDKK